MSEQINAPLSGLFYRTEKRRSEEIRGGALGTRPYSQCKEPRIFQIICRKKLWFKEQPNPQFLK